MALQDVQALQDETEVARRVEMEREPVPGDFDAEGPVESGDGWQGLSLAEQLSAAGPAPAAAAVVGGGGGADVAPGEKVARVNPKPRKEGS